MRVEAWLQVEVVEDEDSEHDDDEHDADNDDSGRTFVRLFVSIGRDDDFLAHGTWCWVAIWVFWSHNLFDWCDLLTEAHDLIVVLGVGVSVTDGELDLLASSARVAVESVGEWSLEATPCARSQSPVLFLIFDVVIGTILKETVFSAHWATLESFEGWEVVVLHVEDVSVLGCVQ